MHKSVQKNHNKANFKKNHSPHPSNKKSADFIPSIRIKSAPLFFKFTSQTLRTLIGPITDPSDPSDLSDLSDTKSISEIYHQPCKTVRSVRSV